MDNLLERKVAKHPKENGRPKGDPTPLQEHPNSPNLAIYIILTLLHFTCMMKYALYLLIAPFCLKYAFY
jgi:hypothetical protein